MKIGVTGASGFIGKHLCTKLESIGHSVIRLTHEKYDITQPFSLPSLDVIFHLAANSKVYLARQQPYFDFRVNALGTLNLLEAIRRAGIPKIIYISSIYAVSHGEPYGFSKSIGERYIQFYSELFGLEYVILRVPSPYGVGMKKGALYDCITGFLSGKVELHVSIMSAYNFVYIDDVVDALVESLALRNESFNLTGEYIRLDKVYNLLVKIMGGKVPLETIDNRAVISRDFEDHLRFTIKDWRKQNKS